ncbi:MAG TPA: diacylglycerol kinase [Sulfuriferula sp.]|nr:diacylglycerol kinase [Sulfuriferula sp.]
MKNRPFLERLGFALTGIAAAWRGEASFRIQLVIAAGVVLVLLWLRPAAAWWAIVLLAACLVLAAELFNTALERIIDHLHPEHHPAIKVAKDCAAGAVLVLSLAAIAVFAALLINTWGGL